MEVPDRKTILTHQNLVYYGQGKWKEGDMATSSITANFAIRDEGEAKRFVDAYLSTDRSSETDLCKSPFKFVSGVDNLRRQISRARGRV